MEKQYLAAVSGGPDSMALLDKYHKIIKVVCHVNYNKRPTSLRDMEYVQKYCNKHNIILEILNVDDGIYDTYHKQSNNFQNIARLIRYDFFVKVSKKYQIDTILIAHNKNDFIETAYMQEQRHSCSLFYGIKKNSNYLSLNIKRPLLTKTKKDLQDYCIKNKIDFGIDESNLTDLYERNRIRKIINSWDSTKFNKEYLKITHYNKKYNSFNTMVNKKYKDWEKHQYSVKFFKTINCKYINYIVFLFLTKINISVNSNKINSIINFLRSEKSSTKYRVEKGIFLVKNDKISLINTN